MSVTIDYYPNETKSFDALPQDSPLQHLDYGGMLTMIGNHVQQERAKNRIERRAFLIKKVNNTNLDVTVNKIKEEAKGLKSYVPKEWNKGPVTKANFLKFFESHDISLKYLEDVYAHQSKGKPVIKKNSLFKIKKGGGVYKGNAIYGVVVDNIGKSNVKYIAITEDFMPSGSDYYGTCDSYASSMSIWKCDVVGEFSIADWERYIKALADYNRDMRHRKEFWDNNPILRTIRKPWSYFNKNFDVMNGQIPEGKPYTYGCGAEWDIFKGCIDEKLCNDRENQ
jgi:hypothetical protein